MPFMDTYQSIKNKLKQKRTWLTIGSFMRDHFLTLSYDIGNSALYLNSANRALKLLNLMDKDIDEDNPIFYINVAATLILFIATYRSYLRSNNEFITQELPKCYKSCSLKKGAKTSAGIIGSVFKSFASSGSLFDLTTRVLEKPEVTYPIVGVISLGNLVANLSILNRPDKDKRYREEDDETGILLPPSRGGYSTNSYTDQ